MTRPDDEDFERLSERWLEGEHDVLPQLRTMACGDPALALELRWLEQNMAEHERELDDDEEALLLRTIERITERSRSPRRARVLLIACAIVALAGTAGAAYLAGESAAHREMREVAPVQPRGSGMLPPSTTRSMHEPEPTAITEPAPTPSPPTPRSLRAPISMSSSRSSSAPDLQSAAELFAEASARRRGGQYEHAGRLYERLIRRHPHSPESLASRLSLARLDLTELGNPRRALRHLDEYLQRAPAGPLAPECRYQRTIALRRMGRSTDERRALEQLLVRDPDSVYAPVVMRRLRDMEDQPQQ